MKVYIKNMVCDRCIMVVKSEMEKLNLQSVQITLGEAELLKAPGEKPDSLNYVNNTHNYVNKALPGRVHLKY